jgi:hypothetical protein
MGERGLDMGNSDDRDLLISEWLLHAESGHEDRSWACGSLDRLIAKNPSIAWTVILELVHRTASERAFDFVAAGPLEDFIVEHGAKMIDLIEQQVQGDEVLGKALSKVWLSRDDLAPPILERYWNLGVQRIQ